VRQRSDFRLWVLAIAVLLATISRPVLAESPTELTIVPVVGGDSDVGLGAGYVASLALTKPGVEPYVWRIEAAGAITGKFVDGSLRLGYLDDYLLFVVPHAFVEGLRLETRVGYTNEPGLKYYGLGNASAIPANRDASDDYFEYGRARVGGAANAAYRLSRHFLVMWGLSYAHNEVSHEEDSRLAEDLGNPDTLVRALLATRETHEVFQFSYGVAWEARDSEISTHSGSYHTLRVDLAPGGSDPVPFEWARTNLALRWYLPLLPRRLTFAARVVADLLFGTPPFYELSRYDDTEAIGGGRGVRGVPAQRYYGKVKVFSNLELRTELFRFNAFHKRNVFGVTGFFDGGRLWSDFTGPKRLDGSSVGLKYGVGGGLRLAAGRSFVPSRIIAGLSADPAAPACGTACNAVPCDARSSLGFWLLGFGYAAVAMVARCG